MSVGLNSKVSIFPPVCLHNYVFKITVYAVAQKPFTREKLNTIIGKPNPRFIIFYEKPRYIVQFIHFSDHQFVSIKAFA